MKVFLVDANLSRVIEYCGHEDIDNFCLGGIVITSDNQEVLKVDIDRNVIVNDDEFLEAMALISDQVGIINNASLCKMTCKRCSNTFKVNSNLSSFMSVYCGSCKSADYLNVIGYEVPINFRLINDIAKVKH